MTNNKIVGQQKESLLSVLNENLNKKELKNIEKLLLEKNIISGGGRTSTSVIFKNKDGSEFFPSLSWKPRVSGTKIGTKSPKMIEFLKKYDELKTSFNKEVQ